MPELLLVTVLLAWSALAFGGVYPWAYAPVIGGVLALAAWRWRPKWPLATVSWAAMLLLAACAVQLVPVGSGVFERISPAGHRVVASLDVAYAVGVDRSHALSIEPAATARTLAFLAIGFVWIPVCATVLRRYPAAPRMLARNVAIVGTIVGLIGLAQKATFNGKLLWFWTPQFFATNSFGPFVNRNHFAGWMLLALATTVGLLFARLGRSGPPRAAAWRDRILWIGSPAAAPILLIAAAALVMACALVWSMSRSGIAAAGVALTIMLIAAVVRARGSVQRWVLAGYLLCVIAGVVSWRGADTLVGWYGRTATLEWRMQLWRDTLPVLNEFWTTGSGLNTYRTLMLVEPRTDLTSHPNAAHNDYLQLAVEGGLLVTVPALLLMGAVSRRILQALRASQDDTTWWIRMGSVAALCGMAVQELTEFSLQIPAVALLFGTCLAMATHDAAPARARRESQPRPDAGRAAA